MKFLQTLLISSLAITVASQAMDKDSNSDSFKKVTSSRNTRRAQRSPERTIKTGTSIPELAKMINVVLRVQKQNRALLDGQKSTVESLKQIMASNKALSLELKKTQQTVEEQKVQIGQLCALLKSTSQDLLPSSFLHDSEGDVELEPSLSTPLPLVSEFKPMQLREWQGSLESSGDNQLLGSPNHPRLPSIPSAHNPWLSPNHTRK